MLRLMLVVLLLTSFASAADSPLVALANRTNRKASKTRVITNETLAASKGRISVASGEAAGPSAGRRLPPAPAPPPRVAPQQAQTAAPSATTTPAYAPTTARNIEPSSSAQSITPQSTAGTIQPSSGARRIDPQNTSRTIQPASTARTIEPQANRPPG